MEPDDKEKQSGEGGISSRKSSLDGQPLSTVLLSHFANDYSQYLDTDLSQQITSIEEFIDESVAKLEELRSLFEMKENERKTWKIHVIPDLIRTGTLLSITLNQRLDALSYLIISIQNALDVAEAEILNAENYLGISSHSMNTSTALRSVLKYFRKDSDSGSNNSAIRDKVKKDVGAITFKQLKSTDPLQLSQIFH